MIVYDWLEIILTMDDNLERKQWVFEVMNERGIKALPRNISDLQRAIDSRETWLQFGLLPSFSLNANE